MYFAARLLSRRGYSAHFLERLGFLPRSFLRTSPGTIWLHAVSVGEVVSLVPLLRLLRAQIPNAPLFLSTSTQAGRQAAEKQTTCLVDGIFFLPFDFGLCLRRAFRTIRPASLIVVETEIWPNLFALAYDAGTSVAIINARISDRAWPTYRKWRHFFNSILQIPDLVQVQSATDYARYAELGVPPEALATDANLKYDAVLPAAPLDFSLFGAEQIWIAASTVGPDERGSITRHSVDEDDIVLQAFQQLAAEFPKLLLILAPRQPARFDEVAAKLKALNICHGRRSAHPSGLQLPGVLLLDTMGELARIYALATVVFVGGSIAPRGGHNIIEPAAAGVPVIVGPHMHNFAAIAQNFLSANALLQLQDGSELAGAVRSLLRNARTARQLGQRAQALVNQNRGVSQRTLDRLSPLYFVRSFHRPRSFPVYLLLNGLAWLWRVGGTVKRRQDERQAAQREPLAVPVISVGGLGAGGVGKTPFVIALAKLLRTTGVAPAILTRGYKRRSRSMVVAQQGDAVPVSETGDEAQILLQTPGVPLGIGADRYQAAQLLMKQFPQTGLLLLDDGFQHARLRRALDIVLFDALDPFGNGQLIPAGRLREPLTAISRAQIAIITRSDCDARFTAISGQIRRYNSGIQVFRTDTLAGEWRNSSTGNPVVLHRSRRAAAFCGLGNPYSFWVMLDSLPVTLVFKKAFSDHHPYTAHDLRSLTREARAMGADVLLTTEKDRFNLPDEQPEMELLYLPIEVAIRDEQRFLELVSRVLSS